MRVPIAVGLVLMQLSCAWGDDAVATGKAGASLSDFSQSLSATKKLIGVIGLRPFRETDPVEFPKPLDPTKLPLGQLEKEKYDLQCSKAVKAFSRIKISMENKYSKNFFPKMDDNDRNAFLLASSAYEAACMDTISQLKPNVQGLLDLVGVVTNDFTPFCTAFRVNEDTVVTSRHCFFNVEDNTPTRTNLVSERKVSFIPLSGNVEPVKVVTLTEGKFYREHRDDKEKISPRNDYILLKLELPWKLFSGVTIKAPTALDDILLLGYYPFSKETVAKKENYKDYIADLRSHFRMTKASGCYVYAVAQSCIYYGCQAQQGFSGAPVLTVTPNSELAILGIHTSDVLSGQDICPRKSNGFGNLGISLSDDVIAVAKIKKGGK